jgi:hypothetical protein
VETGRIAKRSQPRTHHAAQANYDFERRERERLKSLKNAARADAKMKPPGDEAQVSVPAEEPAKE